jgi:hypothetical protein
VTHLRQIMLEELGRNYSRATKRYYIRAVEDFSRRFKAPAGLLGSAAYS